jgi:nucleotide-binding universal stress UspA family protein
MRAVVWVTEAGWAAAVDLARAVLGPEAEIELLHVTPAETEAALAGPRHGLLGRHRPPPPPPVAPLEREAEEVLADAAARLGRPAARTARTGRLEDEVLRAAQGADLLVLPRDGEERPGPRSLAPPVRFVVDHARVAVLLAPPG